MLDRSGHIRTGNFAAIGVADLGLLFDLYDAEFFGGLLRRMLREDGAGELGLRLSGRMTRAAGKTTMQRSRVRSAIGTAVRVEYEIAVSTLLLFQTFREAGRPVVVGGLICRDRLEALQRIMEHELLHLAEFLAWGRSSCTRPNFHALSRRIFAHEGTTHDLVTPRELAAERHGIRIGDRVRFEHEGKAALRAGQPHHPAGDRPGRRPARAPVLRRQAVRDLLRPARATPRRGRAGLTVGHGRSRSTWSWTTRPAGAGSPAPRGQARCLTSLASPPTRGTVPRLRARTSSRP